MGSFLIWVKQTFGWDYPPLRMHPEELDAVMGYHERTNRGVPTADSECSPARPMFLLRAFTGNPEHLYVDTSKGQITRQVFFRQYDGKPERVDNLEIKPR